MKQFIALIIIAIFQLSCEENSKPKSKDNIKLSLTESCMCFDGIGSSKNDEPKLTYFFKNNRSVSICGFIDNEMHEEGFIISEFNIFDCDDGKSYVQYGAVKMCRIVEKENELEIQDLRYLPVGDDWSWTLIQIGEQTIKPNGDELYVSELKPKIQPYTISKKQADDFLHSLKQGEGFNSDWEQIIGRLEALSIIGDKRAWNILKDLENYTGRKFDGALAETWKESVMNIKWIQKQ